jgi:uracil-DNA glycosylase
MTAGPDFHAARAMLLWQIELGADEAIGEAPVDRYAVAEAAPVRVPVPAAEVPVAGAAAAAQVGEDPVGAARRLAEGAATFPACARRWRAMTIAN